jgi:acylphosphatase
MKTFRVLFSGHVQGVGFRYTAQTLAENYPRLSGWVRNLPDGDVELAVTATEADRDAFLSDIKAHFARYITETKICEEPQTEQYHGFSIR